jgi:hypothetical protein
MQKYTKIRFQFTFLWKSFFRYFEQTVTWVFLIQQFISQIFIICFFSRVSYTQGCLSQVDILRRVVIFNKLKDSLFHSTVYSPCPMKITKLHFLEFMFLFKMTLRMKSLNTFSNIRRWKTKSLNVLGISDLKRFD